MERERVCVTGAGGFVASWLIKLLLSDHRYSVHATLRNPSDPKYEYLKKMDNLKLYKADLLDYPSLSAAINGCAGVFHVASPVPSTSLPNPEVELIEPAVNGTLHVLRACSQHQIKRVVFVSSSAAVVMNPDWPRHQVKDENCWSDKNYCRTTNNWYCASKTEAEMEAFQYAQKHGLNLVTLCPTLVLGPLMHPTLNSSSLVLIKLLKEGYESIENKLRMIVDVRDVANALRLIYEKPEAEGRYICTAYLIRTRELVDKLRTIYPNFNYPRNFTENGNEEKVTSEKLQKLGWRYKPLEECLVDSVESYKALGLLN